MALTSLLDVVDEGDNVIGQASVQEVREKGLIHRIARIMIEDGKGNVLLQLRANKVIWPNCWDNSAAGHVDAGEDYLTAAKRELFEEIGLKVELNEVDTYFTDAIVGPHHLKRFNRLYKAVIDFTPTQLEPEEVREVRWFSVADVKQLVSEHPDQVTDGLADVVNRFY